MAFRFVRSAGLVAEPAALNVYASGIVHVGGAVDLLGNATNSVAAMGFVSPSQAGAVGTGTSVTALFGVATSGAVGNSDTLVNVVPVIWGQLWEVDCAQAASTLQLGKRHQLYSDLLINNTSYDNSSTVGVFLALAVSGATTGSGKLIGFFAKQPTVQQVTAQALNY